MSWGCSGSKGSVYEPLFCPTPEVFVSQHLQSLCFRLVAILVISLFGNLGLISAPVKFSFDSANVIEWCCPFTMGQVLIPV